MSAICPSSHRSKDFLPQPEVFWNLRLSCVCFLLSLFSPSQVPAHWTSCHLHRTGFSSHSQKKTSVNHVSAVSFKPNNISYKSGCTPCSWAVGMGNLPPFTKSVFFKYIQSQIYFEVVNCLELEHLKGTFLSILLYDFI